MTSELRCFSFHSVKGGVGKSTLSTLVAVALAQARPSARVYLVDMDLTGTSLADVLLVEAPRWDNVATDEAIDLLKPPTGFHGRSESKRRMQARREVDSHAAGAVGVPFLNDYLLFEPQQWDEEHDVSPTSIAWKFVHGPANLRVFPSSALPRDLNRALPVIYDEEHAAFLEARMEGLLEAIATKDETAYVVFDTPPTIPGLSRSVLNLAFRLSREPKTSLAVNGVVPYALEEATMQWQAFIVATLDYQDIRAAERWLDLVKPEDQSVVRLVLNRVRVDEKQRDGELQRILQDDEQRQQPLRAGDREPTNRLSTYILDPVWIDESKTKQELFRQEGAPPWERGLLHSLGIDFLSDEKTV